MINNFRSKAPFYAGYTIAIITLAFLLILSQATEGSEEFEAYYKPLLVTVISGISVLVLIVFAYLFSLFRNHRRKIPGASLSWMVLWRSVLLAFIPLFFVSYFAFKFLRYEFQSSFDEGINDALNNALVLSNKALQSRGIQVLKNTKNVANIINSYGFNRLQTDLEIVRNNVGASELTVFDENGFIQAYASENLNTLIPEIPAHDVFAKVKADGGTFSIETDKAKFQIRTMVQINKFGSSRYYLQGIFHIPDSISDLASQVNRTISERDKLNYLMPRVNSSFIFVLILVILLSGLLLILSSIRFATNMTEPLRVLIQSTKRVSKGNFDKRIAIQRKDDFGTLMKSFNEMTNSLRKATLEAEFSRNQVESERAYLETVIDHMTAGVITLDFDYRLQTFNERAEQILGTNIQYQIYTNLSKLDLTDSLYILITQVMYAHNNGKGKEIEVNVNIEGTTQKIIANVTPLPSTDSMSGGYVLIFDDISHYLQQQKQEAWEEVARRLAHEIKNPLTPIQLAAERLHYKLADHLDDKEKKVLSRSIEVITNQVKSLKDMVNDFSDYAKPISNKKNKVSLSQLTEEVFELYRGHYEGIQFILQINSCVHIKGNQQLLRQVLHNVIKNAIEACESIDSDDHSEILIELSDEKQEVILKITDNGIGLANNGKEVFEPYVTTKEKGTGLGLAIVKKIIHDHNGTIQLHDRNNQHGTIVTITFPIRT